MRTSSTVSFLAPTAFVFSSCTVTCRFFGGGRFSRADNIRVSSRPAGSRILVTPSSFASVRWSPTSARPQHQVFIYQHAGLLPWRLAGLTRVVARRGNRETQPHRSMHQPSMRTVPPFHPLRFETSCLFYGSSSAKPAHPLLCQTCDRIPGGRGQQSGGGN